MDRIHREPGNGVHQGQRRLQAMVQANYRHGFAVTLQEHMLERPLSWRRPQTIFVNSMSDLFHEQVPLAFIASVFDVMARADWVRFQVLTKRPNGSRNSRPNQPGHPTSGCA